MCALGGRAAEELFKKISTGALSDLKKSLQAYAMISIYGMNKKVGNISYYDLVVKMLDLLNLFRRQK